MDQTRRRFLAFLPAIAAIPFVKAAVDTAAVNVDLPGTCVVKQSGASYVAVLHPTAANDLTQEALVKKTDALAKHAVECMDDMLDASLKRVGKKDMMRVEKKEIELHIEQYASGRAFKDATFAHVDELRKLLK